MFVLSYTPRDVPVLSADTPTYIKVVTAFTV